MVDQSIDVTCPAIKNNHIGDLYLLSLLSNTQRCLSSIELKMILLQATKIGL
jgi:hypothetical protein